ncbi:MAG: DUF4426 domain-containing protein [Porticoccaceae bacterium]|nr:DUF4426 domain-containing protein [Porticoccaceae bacterium]MDG1474291.1 DUF4426 domain-containing protein [Porticoccaceae bacterium]
MLRLVWVFLLMCLSIQAHTVEEKLYKQHGNYKIFYSAFNTSFITPDIASANNIVRGKNKGLVNISVMEDLAIGVPSTITGRVFNILQQSQTLHFEAIKEQQSIYYLAPFEFDDQDYLTFKITVKPNDGARSYDYDFKFQKKMYHD